MADPNKKEIDDVTGVETTGHEWDGLKELNNPAPRWWLWVFYVTVVWAVGYWVVYPAWPTFSNATKGRFEWTEYKKLAVEQKKIMQRQQAYLDRFAGASFEEIMHDPQLYAFAVAGGKAAFKDNCATCHGTGAAGGNYYPNLNDDDWLWGGKIEEIYQTISYGVRSGHDEAHLSQMPSFGKDKLLARNELEDVVKYVRTLNKKGADETHPGYKIFQTNCAACHGVDGKGSKEFGAPNLTDAIWLYGGDYDAVYNSVSYAHGGAMPFWKGRLSDHTIRQLAVYVYSLGGGEESNTENDSKVPDTGRSGQQSK